jgi:hypothetical protein
MNLSRWPSTKTNGLKPWYLILRSLLVFPFSLFFGLGLYLCLFIDRGSEVAVSFRKDWLDM